MKVELYYKGEFSGRLYIETVVVKDVLEFDKIVAAFVEFRNSDSFTLVLNGEITKIPVAQAANDMENSVIELAKLVAVKLKL